MRPYQIWKLKAYHRPVEVISYPCPDRRVFIRMIPGDPTSAQWVDVDELQAVELRGRNETYIHFAVVSGALSFPTDMLRYDFCGIHSRSDSGEVTVYQVNRQTRPNWHKDRWLSFGWILMEKQSCVLLNAHGVKATDSSDTRIH